MQHSDTAQDARNWRKQLVRGCETSKLVETERRQRPPVSTRKIIADDDLCIQGFRHRLDPAHQINSRADDGEVKAIRSANVAVDDPTDMQCYDDLKRRLASKVY